MWMVFDDFHSRFVVEIWHFPPVFFVVIVVGVGWVVRGCDGLGVGCGSPVVEVDLWPVGVGGSPKDLLRAGPARPVGPEADHPSQQDQEDQEDHASSHAPGDVGEVRLVLTVKACKNKYIQQKSKLL